MVTTENLYEFFLKAEGVSTDSRTVKKNALFFALKGPNFNGNKYADEALKKGALAVVVDEADFKKGENYLLVNNGLKALQELAHFHRSKLNIPVIAIAGSNGKTTSKELINAVLKTSFDTYATEGNLNNEIGVPLTLLRLTAKTQMAVVEMGARQLGDIRVLCEIANPTHGIITNTGKDHLETFKTLENTLKTNAELYQHLSNHDGIAFVNISDKDLCRESGVLKKRITYGNRPNANHYGGIISSYPYLVFNYRSENDNKIEIKTKLTGKYNFENAMAAVAIAKHFKITDDLIKEAIESYVPSNNRSQLLTIGSNTFILDAYNANPSSMKEAIENFAGIESENKIAILGDMLELGDVSYEEHLAVIESLRQLKLKKIVLVGNEFGKVCRKIECVHFNTTKETADWFKKEKFENSTFLLKGSRMIGLEKILS